jgi:hypothetical protein
VWEKVVQKCSQKKLLKENNHPLGEHSPELVTLLIGQEVRVTRLCEFSAIGRLLYILWAVLLKSTEVAQMFGPLHICRGKSCALILTKVSLVFESSFRS